MGRMFITEWKVIKDFPSYEINKDGIIRKERNKVQHSTYVDQYNQEVTKLTENGKRHLRVVSKLIREAFPD